ncbi:hypothetical protein HN51_000331 [Arachis hypogaea]|uniref:25S rRNA (uridine-N(3))-methyltransferase BMT5-like domain-containing protein n=1 Tax=Arachis hypogaea TaxID=3818 RepID=A0A445EWB5_ARAHY|nr:heavy metal-associated isoprenylated plant protein 41 [Arachis hypogaea]QHO48181.1 uncharacterized protein DS421_1g03370 [Arachis hypogaea]RYR79719.1 hypothetical protein Ahy_A01g004537 [Arachis hypogaea]
MEKEEVGAKWVTHYSSDHQILLVGDGDFSFSLSLARSFGSASNIVASSLDSYDDVTKNYKQAKSNLDELQKLGACLYHGVDATKMKYLLEFKMRRFDRIIFNFPHAGFHGKEDNLTVIQKHKDLVLGFFKNASCMLSANGEIHVNHKTSPPFSNWEIEKLGEQSLLTLIELADFRKEDYPGYNNKRGDSGRCDEPFPLGMCSTYKFIFNPRATMRKCERKRKRGLGEQICRPYQEIQDARQQLQTTSVYLNCYFQSNQVSKFQRIMSSLYGLSNEHAPIGCGYLNNVDATHHRAAHCAAYYSLGMRQSSQRLLQPMKPLNSFQPWPTLTNVRYSQTNYVRTTDITPLPLVARNEGYQVYSGSSNYMGEAVGGTVQSYPYERVERPEFQSHISQLYWREVVNGGNYVHSVIPRMSVIEERNMMFIRS